MGGHLLSVYSASKASNIKRLTANLTNISIRRYKNESNVGHGVEERAPSTAEEFERVAQEKTQKAHDDDDHDDEAVSTFGFHVKDVKEEEGHKEEEEPSTKTNFQNTRDQ